MSQSKRAMGADCDDTEQLASMLVDELVAAMEAFRLEQGIEEEDMAEILALLDIAQLKEKFE